MSAGEMDRCECRAGHTGPLMVLVAVQCTGGCGEASKAAAAICHSCRRMHWLPFAAVAGCFLEEITCGVCDGQALLVLEPLASFAGVES